MAVAPVKKILIISHESQAQALLAAVQKAGIVHLLDADNAAVIKAYKELKAASVRDRSVDELCHKLEKAVTFLKQHHTGKPLATLLAPKVVVDDYAFERTVSSKETRETLDDVLTAAADLDELTGDIDSKKAKLNMLMPWKTFKDDLESFGDLSSVDVFTGVVSAPAWDELSQFLNDPQNGAVVNVISRTKAQVFCVIIVMKEKSADVYKQLRTIEFEAVSFDGFNGSVSDNIDHLKRQIHAGGEKVAKLRHNAHKLADSLLDIQMMYDYYVNIRSHAAAFNSSPATEQTRIFEGWVKTGDMPKLQELMLDFDAASVCEIAPLPDEAVPVDIENNHWAKPFEVITKLYGVPRYFELDPTVILAPFFAIFFALCLTDAGYGLVMIAASVYVLNKMQAGKRFMSLILVCSILTVFTGAMTGGWFGSLLLDFAVKYNFTGLETLINKMTWFNPLEDPMTFLVMAIVLGYIQIMVGLFAGFVSVLKNKGIFAAVFDKLTWIVLLNSILVMAISMAGILPAVVGKVAIMLIYLAAAGILFLSHREGGIGARLGMGGFNLFSAIFYLGDLLSYLRLMALGMATGGVAMAINIIGGLISDVPYVGFILAVIFMVCGHVFNILQSILGAFVHSMRLQFVEFFPKFMEGGAMPFTPFVESYKYVYIKQEESKNE